VAERRLGGTGFSETGKPDGIGFIGFIARAQGSPHDLGTHRHIGLEPRHEVTMPIKLHGVRANEGHREAWQHIVAVARPPLQLCKSGPEVDIEWTQLLREWAGKNLRANPSLTPL